MSDASVQPSPAQMTPNARMMAAAERAETRLGPAVGAKLKGFLTPEALEVLGATAGLWAVAQFTPVGWVADLAAAALGGIAIVGAAALGYDIGGGLNELIDFVKTARAAQTDADLDAAAQHLANAVSTLGVDTVQAIILHKTVKNASAKSATQEVAETKSTLPNEKPGACAVCENGANPPEANSPDSSSPKPTEQKMTDPISNSVQTPEVPVAKFRDYIFKEEATHGKAAAFEQLGYGKDDSAALAQIYQQQAASKYAAGEYTLGKKDAYGQRINIEIELEGKGAAASKKSYLKTGWMIKPDGSIGLNTPFAGYMR